MNNVLTLILGGGRGTNLFPLTANRSEPAVPLAGKYRLIDVPLSNCLNSGLRRVYVLTQFQSVSLHRHITNTYSVSPFTEGFVDVLHAQQTNETADWYQGTADALRQNARYVETDPCTEVLVLSGDQLYRMDFELLIQRHRETGAAVTVAAVPVGRGQASRMGILRLGDDDRVTHLVEKPQGEAELRQVRTPPQEMQRRGLPSDGREFLANMGIYVFSRAAFLELLTDRMKGHDIVREIIAPTLAERKVCGHVFTGYWDDLGSIKSYYEAHLALAGDNPPFDFHDPEGVIYTRMRNLPAARVRAARVEHCLISDGCRIEPGTELQRCVIGVRSHIGANATLRDVVFLGADALETDHERAHNQATGQPHLGVGEGTVIEKAIIDKDCRIGKHVRIVNERRLEEASETLYHVRDGIVVIPEGAVIPDGTVI